MVSYETVIGGRCRPWRALPGARQSRRVGLSFEDGIRPGQVVRDDMTADGLPFGRVERDGCGR